MELLAVRTARFVPAIALEEMNPRGLTVYPLLIPGLVEKYGFAKYPTEQSDLDESKGVTFEDGDWNGKSIDKISFFNDFMIVDMRSSTTDSEAFFYETMEWARETFGITFKETMVTQKAYLSEVIFNSDVELNKLNKLLEGLAKSISSALSEATGSVFQYETAGFSLYYDTSRTKTTYAPFRFERLDNSSYEERKYYSSAPLPTDIHLKMIEEVEKIISL